MMFDKHLLAGKTVVVTGASGGLGRHFAQTLAVAGAKVMVAARRMEALDELAAELSGGGLMCEAVPLDIADTASIADFAPYLATADILVNNAGVARAASALRQSEQDWDAVMDVNLKGLFFLCQRAAAAMKARGAGGSIINIASIAGIRQNVGLAPYGISKAGVIHLTKTLALEFAPLGIRVNAIAPGSFSTEITGDYWQSPAGEATVARIPQGRLGRYEDLDGALLLLASEASAYMTGSVIVVDGGHSVGTL